MANFIDKAVGAVAPIHAAKRAYARKALTVINSGVCAAGCTAAAAQKRISKTI